MTAVLTEVELDVLLERKEELAAGVVRLTLRHPAGDPLPEWEPGAHLDLVLGEGMVRQYSLCGDPADRGVLQVAVLREPDGRGGSAWVHDRLSTGDTVRVRGPRNHFRLVDSPRYLFVAGGIGITPIVPMIVRAEASGADWRLVYGGRSRASMAFREELVARYGDRVDIRPQDETGLLDLGELLGAPRDGVAVYCCGPEPLLAAVEQRCAVWPPGSLHVERFSPKAGADAGERTTFEVELAASGRTVTVPPDKSILAAVEEAGVSVLSSCQEGTCGTCETPVLDGVPDHRDSLLTDEERAANDTMMICVSRSCGPRLVLDL
ncbi:PDR/VanB family oxidoreductase [Amycolatopsis methanolica]|uniref:Phthalate 4,5-dioxygenase reductase subunit n=1 Tax=Amycolatopsis methanolica 239 TaxID=1068978 RepID=A0A076MZF3_AMYME|nr:PDR/VanB family oxidoreductase [Amycolatopsis methanolica]AIJ24306.1 phthalate 4,5-dioxygenase reductase subunit [Amycolatopsis methanolica 239]